MFGFGKSENLKDFEKTIKGMGAAETRYLSCSVYKLWQMFNVKYKSVENWKKNQDNIVEWITFLDTLQKDNIKRKWPGIYHLVRQEVFGSQYFSLKL